MLDGKIDRDTKAPRVKKQTAAKRPLSGSRKAKKDSK
jgi:hypothetical protein